MLVHVICLVSNLLCCLGASLTLCVVLVQKAKDLLLLWICFLALCAGVGSVISVSQQNGKRLGIAAMLIYVLCMGFHIMYMFVTYECKHDPRVPEVLKLECSRLLFYPDRVSIRMAGMCGFLATFLCCTSLLLLIADHFVLQSKRSNVPFVTHQPLKQYDHQPLKQYDSEFTELETQFIEMLKSSCVDPRYTSFTDLDWLRLAWSRKLDIEETLATLAEQARFSANFNLEGIDLATVHQHVRASQLPVLAGKDLVGRSILWQRMRFLDPKDSTGLIVGMKAAWLTFDAALSNISSIRKGICLAYDFTGAGLQNVSAELMDMTNGPLAASGAHPSHVSRILFVNMPWALRMAYNIVKVSLPEAITSSVEMVDTDTPSWYNKICRKTELPEFLGGTKRGDYVDWLNRNLANSHGIYGPMAVIRNDDPVLSESSVV